MIRYSWPITILFVSFRKIENNGLEKVIRTMEVIMPIEKASAMVHYLRNAGIETFGMDRLIDATTDSQFIQSDWMDYTFQSDRWGSIIANHSFALHFLHQNERKDGDYIGYAKKYMTDTR